MLAQNKAIRECKVIVKKVKEWVCRMTGEIQDEELEDIASTLPLQSKTAVAEVEEKLQSPEYAQAMVIKSKVFLKYPLLVSNSFVLTFFKDDIPPQSQRGI